MELVIEGTNLPGRMFRTACVPIHDVHVGVQVRSEPEQLVPGDAPRAEWRLDIRVVRTDDGFDFRGPAVHGRPGGRFVYLTWVNVGPTGGFEMFRRLKLMLGLVQPSLIERAVSTGSPLRLTLGLTDGHGGPRCGRLDPTTAQWSV